MKPPVPIRAAVEKMRSYHPPLEGRTKKLRLDFNENPIGCSPKVRQALAKLSAAEICSYPEQETVRRQMARHFGVSPAELLLTNGTDEALHVIVNTFVEPDDGVLFVEPTYAMYRFYSELSGAQIVAPRYTSDMQFPWPQVLAILRGASTADAVVDSGRHSGGAKREGEPLSAANRSDLPLSGSNLAEATTLSPEEGALNAVGPRAPRVFFLPNPNSPTGNLLSPPEIRRILSAAKQTMVVIDEAYFEFSGVTVISWIRRHPNLIVTRTFSKTAGLAGLRLGCIFVNRDLARSMRKSQSPYPVNAAALVGAEAALRDRAFIARTVREVEAARQQLERGLARLGIRYFPSGGNFILVYFGNRAKKIVATLDHQGILLRDRSSDFAGEGYVRITVGTPSQVKRLLGSLEPLL